MAGNTPQPSNPIPGSPPGGKSEFELASQEKQPSILVEFVDFLKYNKKWWLLPIALALMLVGALAALTATGAAPFVYTLF